jgi:hypothetical protein
VSVALSPHLAAAMARSRVLAQQTPMFSPFWRHVTCQCVLRLVPREWALVRLLPVQLLQVRFDPPAHMSSSCRSH